MISEVKLIVRYAETDKMGIVHHSVYPVWYEMARGELIKLAGMSYSEVENMGIMLPLVSLTSNYIKSSTYEDELTVTAKVKNATFVKIEFEYSVYNHNNEVINTGTTTHAWVDSITFKPVNIKKKSPKIYNTIQKLLLEN